MVLNKKKIEINLPYESIKLNELNVGDIIYLNGNIMTARDHAHKRIINYDSSKKKLPKIFTSMKNCAIYHSGPIIHEINSKNGTKYKIYSGGPTTSARMEPFQEKVCDILDIKIVIGKGGMKKVNFSNFGGIYLSFTGGCGAIFANFTKNITDVIWLEDLGMPEAIWIIEVENFGPLIVSQDAQGNSLYH